MNQHIFTNFARILDSLCHFIVKLNHKDVTDPVQYLHGTPGGVKTM